MKRTWQTAVVLLLVCGLASAETGIKNVVHVIETRYSIHHHGVPALWLVNPLLWAGGMGGLKMVAFGKFHVPGTDAYLLKEDVRHALGAEWSPFVETWSKTDGWTMIYARTAGGGMKMLIVASDNEDGLTVIQIGLSGRAMRHWIDEPVQCAKDDPFLVKGTGKPNGQISLASSRPAIVRP